MQEEKLRTLIRESIQEYIKEIDEAAETAAMEARIAKCDEAIATRENKLSAIAESDHKDLMDEGKIKGLENEIKELKKAKAKFEKIAEKKAAKKAKKSAPKEEVVTDTMTEEAPVDEADVMAEMDVTDEAVEETAINESFLKMQKLAGVITESQYNQKRRLVENYTPPAYEAINDLMDYIKQSTGVSGNIKPYRSISWLPSVSDTDGDMDMLTYKKGKQEIAIGVDDVYQDQYDENSNVWVINSNDSSLDFGEHMTFDEAVKAVSGWLKSSSSNQSNYGMDDQDMLRNLGWNA